jgi:hypothetical protein
VAASVLPACGSSSGPATPTIGAARTFRLERFRPSAPVEAGKPFEIAFRIVKPDGGTIVRYRKGSGPHTGVHLIVVRRDLSELVHRHPPVAADGSVRDSLTLSRGGAYRVLVDAYPELGGAQRNFQLFEDIRVSGPAVARALGPFRPTVVVDGYRVTLRGAARVRALSPAFVTVTVTDPQGHPASFAPYYGALAHAIFFRARTLDYFHTHVCGPAARGCSSFLGGSSVTGTSTKPGQLRVGVLLPEAGTWRLFLQFRAGGRIVTAPFTLPVR